ncbi:MAG: efflux RND transporter periplasmic adaptor subunit [Alphaproteobacteria bacterium]|nr:efflux RND transporter periplasmic adaptor subunit [Alphaproteobacteria bacterium]
MKVRAVTAVRRLMARFGSPMSIAVVISAGVVLWVLSGQIGTRNVQDGRATPPATERPQAPPPLVRVLWLDAEPRQNVLVLHGHTEAVRRVDLRIETPGRVAAIGADKGALVAKGDVVLRLATEDREARLAEARALVRQRQIEADVSRQLHQRGHRADTQVAATDAALEAARAQLARMDVELARTVLRAPFAGVIDRRPAEIGAYLKEGDLVATLVDLDPLLIVVHASERDVGKLEIGQRGIAKLVDGATVEGQVRYIAVAGESATRTFRVEFAIANPQRRQVDGATAQLHLPLELGRAHRLSPATLTLAEDGIVGVKTVGSDQRVEFHAVKILGQGADGIWVSGLPDRVRLITVGQEFVKPGQLVKPVDAGAIKPGQPS